MMSLNMLNVYELSTWSISSSDSFIVIIANFTGKSLETEDHDRADISLPGKQLQLLQDAVGSGRFIELSYHYVMKMYICILNTGVVLFLIF